MDFASRPVPKPRWNDEQSASSEHSRDVEDDEDYTSDHSSETGSDDKGITRNYGEANRELAKKHGKDSRRVLMWSANVAFVILSIASLIMVAVWVFINVERLKIFNELFEGDSVAVLESMEYHSKTIMKALESRSIAITSYAMTQDARWPYVMMPDFHRWGGNFLAETFLGALAFAPIVQTSDRLRWEKFAIQKQEKISKFEPEIFELDRQNRTIKIREEGPGPYSPLWQMVPAESGTLNFNIKSYIYYEEEADKMIISKEPVISEVLQTSALLERSGSLLYHEPHSAIFYPIFESFEKKEVVGLLLAQIHWEDFLTSVLPNGISHLIAVIRNSCGQAYTFYLNEGRATYIGTGDTHDPNFNDMEVSAEITAFDFNYGHFNETDLDYNICRYRLIIYPTSILEESSKNDKPAALTFMVFLFFAILSLVFLLYIRAVDKQQQKLMETAVRTRTIVTSLFPANVRDRILVEAEEQAMKGSVKMDPNGFLDSKKGGMQSMAPLRARSTSYDTEVDDGDFDNVPESAPLDRSQSQGMVVGNVYGSKPIADLFPETTVLFADIVGFTAWSSVREPEQVFQLLETIYHTFDKIADKRGVFKVETIGDCYLAVTGIPKPVPDHAVVTALFAHDCLRKMKSLTKAMEVTLGPDTGTLTMRFGLHSGPVTAGVLRGAKSRFQLFGDTVNTAARTETTGQAAKIHVSETTAKLLCEAGKSHWVTKREDKVQAKGKGQMQTYWVNVGGIGKSLNRSSMHSMSDSDYEDESSEDSGKVGKEKRQSVARNKTSSGVVDKFGRLIEWNVDQLIVLLEKIEAKRKRNNKQNPLRMVQPKDYDLRTVSSSAVHQQIENNIITPTSFKQGSNIDDNNADHFHDEEASTETLELEPAVVMQLHDYIESIASFYGNNAFHNFSHASHMAMSIMNLLRRIDFSLDETDFSMDETENGDLTAFGESTNSLFHDKERHESIFGPLSNPLTQFALVLSALIHDVEHTGVTNAQLIKEGAPVIEKVDSRSVHEQLSVKLAFEVLMENKYNALRSAIYQDEQEFEQFRQIVFNSVLATDIIDVDMLERHATRWQSAFESAEDFESETEKVYEMPLEETHPVQKSTKENFMTTVLIEHLIQSADIAHTMQHWNIYRKWNELLFEEIYAAYLAGREDKDPAMHWYQSEIHFFDNFVIPLAKKLSSNGALGSSFDDHLTYALCNREEWELKGEEVVQEMMEQLKARLDIDERDTESTAGTEDGFPVH